MGDGPADVSAVVSWYGASDLTLDPGLVATLWPDTSTPEREELARRLSPVGMVREGSPPMLLMHGDADSISPVEQSVRLHEAAQRVGARCELEVFPGSEHVFHGEPTQPYWDRAIAFLDEHLRA